MVDEKNLFFDSLPVLGKQHFFSFIVYLEGTHLDEDVLKPFLVDDFLFGRELEAGLLKLFNYFEDTFLKLFLRKLTAEFIVFDLIDLFLLCNLLALQCKFLLLLQILGISVKSSMNRFIWFL